MGRNRCGVAGVHGFAGGCVLDRFSGLGLDVELRFDAGVVFENAVGSGNLVVEVIAADRFGPAEFQVKKRA